MRVSEEFRQWLRERMFNLYYENEAIEWWLKERAKEAETLEARE